MVVGFRDKINKEKIMKKMSIEDWRRLKLQQDFENITDEDAKHCAVRSDQMYQEFDKLLGNIEAFLLGMLNANRKIKKYEEDIKTEKNEGDRIETEYEVINLNRTLKDFKRSLWALLASLWRYVNAKRIDRKIFFTKEQYAEKVKFVKDRLKEQGIELYDQR